MKQPAMFRAYFDAALLLFLTAMLLPSCTGEHFYLARSSPVPKHWTAHPRLAGKGPLRVDYYNTGPGEIVAKVRPRQSSFIVVREEGAFRWPGGSRPDGMWQDAVAFIRFGSDEDAYEFHTDPADGSLVKYRPDLRSDAAAQRFNASTTEAVPAARAAAGL